MDAALEFIKEWARVIVAAGLMAGVIDMLCPAGSFRQPIRLVMGLIVLIAVASPVVQLFSGGAPVVQGLVGPARRGDRTDWSVAGDQLAAGLSVLLRGHPGVDEAQIIVEPGPGEGFDVSSIRVVILPARPAREGEVDIEPVVIGGPEPDGAEQLAADVTTAVMLYTGLDADRIQVTVRQSR